MYTYITDKDAKNYTPAADSPRVFALARKIEGITIHHWGDPAQNPTFDGIVNYLCNNTRQVSAHYVASGTDRKVACLVNPGDVAWHAGSAWGNARTIGIECDPRARDEDYDVVAELIADIRSAFGDVPLYWHSYFVQTACPGKYDVERLDRLSYTKYSANEWGKGGNKVPASTTPAAPVIPPAQPAEPVLYRIYDGSRQVAAYSVESNAFKGYVNRGGGALVIRKGGTDVTQELINKYRTPAPTTVDSTGVALPDTGKPLTEKQDYEAPQTPAEPAVEPAPATPQSVADAQAAAAALPNVIDTAISLGQQIEKNKAGQPQTFWEKHFNKQKILLDLAAFGTALSGFVAWAMGNHELLGQILTILSGILFGGNRFNRK